MIARRAFFPPTHRGILALTAGLLALGLLSSAVASAAELTLDDVIARHLEARGGVERWRAVESLSISGSFTAFSQVGRFTQHQTTGGQFYFSRDEGDEYVVTGSNGKDHWMVHPFFGPWPNALPGPDLVVLAQEVDLPNPFFHLEEKGYQPRLVGDGDFDGAPAVVVELVRPEGETETWYFDPETFFEMGRDSTGSDYGRAAPQQTFFDDFRSIDGLMIPHYIEKQWYTRNRIYEVEEVTLDGDLETALFDLPLSVEMEPLRAMVGGWEVTYESRQSPTSELATTHRTAKIEALIRGGMVEERFTAPDSGTEVLRQWTHDRFRAVYRLTQINSTTTYLDIQEGHFDDQGHLVVSNLETDSGWTMAFGNTKINERNTLRLEEDGFVLETEYSLDGGVNWFVGVRETYLRTTP